MPDLERGATARTLQVRWPGYAGWTPVRLSGREGVNSLFAALTSGAHISLSAGRSLLASARDAIRLFAAKAGMRLVAASGDIDITALQNAVHLLAKLEITHTAERITITARQEVLINGGGSYSRWNAAGVTHGTEGAWTAHAAGHAQVGPDGLPVVMPAMSTGSPKARRGFSS